MLTRLARPACLTVLVWLAVCTPQILAATYNLTPSDAWFDLLNGPSLSPGDEVILGAGTYNTGGDRFSLGHVGTAGQPIVIRAADGANVKITRNDAAQNVINIEGSQYLTLKGIEITNGSAGIRIRGANGYQPKFITLDGNKIHDVGDAAVSANFSGYSYEGLHFLNNEIYNTGGTGEGFYLGCNSNTCQMYDSIIERNYIHNLTGNGITQGDGIEIKDGSYNNIIRDNVIHTTKYPAITAYGVEENGAPNIFERNVIWDIQESGMQIAADAIIRNNIVFSASLDALHIQNHQGAIPGNLTIVNNTFRANGEGIDIGSPLGGSYSGPIEIANNAIYPRFLTKAIKFSTSNNLTMSQNIGTGNATGLTSDQFDNTGSLANDFVLLAANNAYLKAGSKLIGAGNASLQAGDDFNTTSRVGSADVGAYVFDPNGNPGWNVTGAFKEFPVTGLSGDFDGDGDVDGHDFLVWQQNPGVGALADWQAHYGDPSLLAVSTSVPEPSSLLLISVGAMLAVRRRRLVC